MPAPDPIANTSAVARELGVTRSAVSRYRLGQRLPALETRKVIARRYGWSVGDQAEAEAKGKWAAGFNRVLKAAGRALV